MPAASAMVVIAERIRKRRPRSVSVVEALAIEFLAIGKNDACKAHDRRAVVGGSAIDGDFVAFLDDFAIPSDAAEHVGTVGLDAPFIDAAIFVFHVEVDEGVR